MFGIVERAFLMSASFTVVQGKYGDGWQADSPEKGEEKGAMG